MRSFLFNPRAELVVLNIHDKNQLHEDIDISSETLNRHRM
jgi:hypothetical protein